MSLLSAHPLMHPQNQLPSSWTLPLLLPIIGSALPYRPAPADTVIRKAAQNHLLWARPNPSAARKTAALFFHAKSWVALG
jgi:hypothetical protein